MIHPYYQSPRRPRRAVPAAGALPHFSAPRYVQRLLAVVLAAFCLASCAQSADSDAKSKERFFTYAVDSPLHTVNAASNLGVSTHADLLAARLYPAMFVYGPKGQKIPNTDVGTAQAIPGLRTKIAYRINPEARFSNGEPLTCTDFFLAVTAGQLNAVFDSRIQLAEQIEAVDCQPGSKGFSVTFRPEQGARWKELFGAGTVMPAHVVARQAGLSLEELHQALSTGDGQALAPVAEAWNTTFNLDNFQPENFPSFGPYAVDSVADDGAVTLNRNQNYNGDPAVISPVTVLPRTEDVAARVASRDAEVVDLGGHSAKVVNRDDADNPYEVISQVGDLTEHLVLANGGTLGFKDNRKALAACVDQEAIARASAAAAGMDVPAVGTHLLSANDPMRQRLAPIEQAHLPVDVAAAEALRGQTIRIGYVGPSARKAAMVQAIAQSCEPAGITVVDVSDAAVGLGDLERTEIDAYGVETDVPGAADAIVLALDPQVEFGSVNGDAADTQALRRDEEALWEDVRTIPLAAQPRNFAVDRKIKNVVTNTATGGLGWNLDRWQEKDQ